MGSNPIVPILLDNENVKFSAPDINRNVIIPGKMTSTLAEDIGIQIGDGGLYFYKEADGDTHYRIECYGHIVDDKIYLKNFVAPLKRKLFNLLFRLKYHNSAGTCYLKEYSKALLTFYSNSIGLPLNNKSKIAIPKFIMSASKSILSACLRGIGDTDFSLTFQKKYKDVHYYPVLHLGTCSKPLVKTVSEALDNFNISSSTVFDYKYKDKRTNKIYLKQDLYISGKKNLNRWLKLIGFRNPKHVTKYQIWENFGFCPPRTDLEQRIKILDGRIYPISFEE